MLTRIEVKNYKLFRHISQPLDAFHILVGSNATGKTTFLDVVSFVSDVVRFGLEEAVARRTNNFDDLTWQGKGGNIEIALEFALPEEVREKLVEINNDLEKEDKIAKLEEIKTLDTIIYEINIELNQNQYTLGEKCLISNRLSKISIPIIGKVKANSTILSEKVIHFLKKDREMGEGIMMFSFGKAECTLQKMSINPQEYPCTFWLRELLTQGIQKFMLDSETLRKASPPNQGKALKPNGGNLPWVLEELKKNHAKLFKRWLAHIRTSLPDMKDIRIIRREDDAHKYFKVLYENGAEVPSWLVSDGTLRMLALTLLAYLPDFKGIYLIEEPENGIHPKAVETIFQSLSSVYEAQVLVASHSTAFLSVAEPKQLLCFSKDETGEAHIIKGHEHPRLQHWKGETNLSILFAGGVLE
jgi:predicted ATPase